MIRFLLCYLVDFGLVEALLYKWHPYNQSTNDDPKGNNEIQVSQCVTAVLPDLFDDKSRLFVGDLRNPQRSIATITKPGIILVLTSTFLAVYHLISFVFRSTLNHTDLDETLKPRCQLC